MLMLAAHNSVKDKPAGFSSPEKNYQNHVKARVRLDLSPDPAHTSQGASNVCTNKQTS